MLPGNSISTLKFRGTCIRTSATEKLHAVFLNILKKKLNKAQSKRSDRLLSSQNLWFYLFIYLFSFKKTKKDQFLPTNQTLRPYKLPLKRTNTYP